MTLRIYLRRSKGDAQQQYSLDVQRDGARDYFVERLANDLGVPPSWWDKRVEYSDDDRSRTDFAGREALLKLQREAQADDLIICRDQSRVGGDALEVCLVLRELIQRRGARLFYYSKQEEVAYSTVMDAVRPFVEGVGSQLEVENLRSRTREALRNRVKSGRLAGGACFGYRNVQHPDAEGRRKNTTAVIDEVQAEIVRRVFAEARAGLGFKRIASRLNADGHRNGRGAQWSAAGVRVLLTNDRYRGVHIHGRINRARVGKRRTTERASADQILVIEVPEWRIVDDLTFAAVRATFKARAQGPRAVGPAAKYALTGIARCQHCEGAVGVDGRAGVSRDGVRSNVPAYTCLRHRKKGPCPVSLMQRHDEVEAALAEYVQARVLTPAVIDQLIAGIREEVLLQASQPASDLETMQRKLTKLGTEQRNLTLAVASGGDEIPELVDALRSRQKQITELKIRLESARRAPAQIDALVAKVEIAVRQKVADLRSALAGDSTGAREAYAALFPGGLTFRPYEVAPLPGASRARRVWAISGMAHLGGCDLVVTPSGIEPEIPT